MYKITPLVWTIQSRLEVSSHNSVVCCKCDEKVLDIGQGTLKILTELKLLWKININLMNEFIMLWQPGKAVNSFRNSVWFYGNLFVLQNYIYCSSTCVGKVKMAPFVHCHKFISNNHKLLYSSVNHNLLCTNPFLPQSTYQNTIRIYYFWDYKKLIILTIKCQGSSEKELITCLFVAIQFLKFYS